MRSLRNAGLIVLGVAVLVVTGWSMSRNPLQAEDADSKRPDAASIERGRRTVKMLDEIYKTAVVLITDKYVHDEDDFPAGSAAVALFAQVTKGGSHAVRLIDATGEPYEEKNVARDGFEKSGIRSLKEGAATVEQVVEGEDGWNLRVLTAVPVVMKKCVMCHPHYADVKKGEAIGAISYTIPLD